MNRQEYLLTCLAEECAEVAQCISKALRFGLTGVQPDQPLTNAQRISEELRDLTAVAEMCEDEHIIPRWLASLGEVNVKEGRIEKYAAISREQGTLT